MTTVPSREPWKPFPERTKKYSKYHGLQLFNYSFHVSLRHRYIYAEVPKCACSPVKLTLQRYELDQPDYFPGTLENIHYRDQSPLLCPKQVNYFNQLLHSPEWFKFCIVRNPYTRLLSCYRDKICRHSPFQRKVIDALVRAGCKKTHKDIPSFSEFIHAIEQQSILEMDPHWKPAFYMSVQDEINYNFVGKFESLETDMQYICKQIGCAFPVYWPNKKLREGGTEDFMETVYTTQLKKRVALIYQVDFDCFGYPA